MSFLSGILDVGKSVVGFFTGNSIASSLAKTAIMGYALTRLNASANKGNDASDTTANIDAGVRLQLSADSSQKIPVLYGTAFFGGNLIDARMSADNKTMWYAMVLSEKTGTTISGSASTYTFKDVYWNEQRIEFETDGITVKQTRDSVGNIDKSLAGLVKVYCYAGNSTSGKVPENYSGSVPAAYSLFPNWASGTHPMNDLIFVLIRVDYNRDRGVTGLGNMLFQVQNSMKMPGDVLKDYMTSTRYGAGIDIADIDTTTLTALNTYSDSTVTYTYRKLDGTTQSGVVLNDRYQINGLIDTGKEVLPNIEQICSASGSWLSYDINEGKWGIIINKAGTSVASFNDNNILGTISVSGTGLQDLYNAAKVEFPRSEIKDSADFVQVALLPADRNANEEDNTLGITYDIINEPVQAQLLGWLELKQSRLDKVIQFDTDFSKINLKPGDIIDITDSRLGFSADAFRIISISENHDDSGALSVSITALDYDDSLYTYDWDRYEISTADGIVTIGSIGTPGTPQITEVERDARPRIIVESTAPTGIVEGMEFWLTNDVSVADDSLRTYKLIATTRPVGGGTYGSGTTVVLEYDALGASNFIIKTRGINDVTVGPYSTPSGSVYFAPVQTTNAIDPNTQMYDATGGLLTGLALTSLASKLLDLFGGDTSKSLFNKIFDVFKDTTGIDLLGDAIDGSLVVASDIAIKSDGSSVSSTVSSIDFTSGLAAEASGSAITAKIMDGEKHRDILVWDNENKTWALGRDCITCDPINPAPKGPETDCYLKLKATLPSNNFQGATALCPNTTSVPYTGSYFAKFEIIPGREGADGVSASSIAVTSEFQWEIAKAGNTDFSWWGAPDNNVGTKWYCEKTPAQRFPNGKTLKEITVGKKYAISAVGTGTAAEIKAAWEAVGWEGTTPVVGDTFIASAVGSDTTRKVTYHSGSGFVFGQGLLKDSIPFVAPLVKGSGSFKLYGTDGKLEQTMPIGSCKVIGDVVEIPFSDRAPGKDYYVIWDEGILTSCACENKKVDNAETWTFTTSESAVSPYVLSQINPRTFGDDAINDDRSIRTRVDWTYTPQSSVCSSSQHLIMYFSQKVKKGTGVITIKDRTSGATAATMPVSSATISQVEDTGSWKVDFGTIPTLDKGKYFDVNAPAGLLLTDTPASSDVVCDKTTMSPAQPDRQSRARDWGFRTDDELKIIKYEYCQEPTGNARKRTNLILTFNKAIKIKEGTAEVTIFGKGLFGGTFQKIDLRGTYANKKYGDIYDAESSVVDNVDTATDEYSINKTITINPTQMMKGNSGYYLNIPAGVIIDAECDVPWEGISDDTTVAWQTDGADPTPPEKLTYGSVYFDFKFDRNVVPGPGKLNIISPTGVLLKQISASDFALKYKHNTPFGG